MLQSRAGAGRVAVVNAGQHTMASGLVRAAALLLLCLVAVSQADIYLSLKEGDVRCFFENVPEVRLLWRARGGGVR